MNDFLKKVLTIGTEERKAHALERIADALDRLAPPPIESRRLIPPTDSSLIETTDEDLCRMEDEEKEREQERLNKELEKMAGGKAKPAS